MLFSFSLMAERVLCALCSETKPHALVMPIVHSVEISMECNSMEVSLLGRTQKRVL